MFRAPLAVAAAVAIALGAGAVSADHRWAAATSPPGLVTAGLVATAAPDGVRALSEPEAVGAAYLSGSNVLRRADGTLVLDPGRLGPLAQLAAAMGPDRDGMDAAAGAVAADRAWLAAGTVPGRWVGERHMAERALLDLRLLLREDGAVPAAWHSYWRYTWPRDAAWVAAALAATGHDDDAARVLAYLGRLQRPDGTWEARYRLNGRPVRDGRAWQLDACGWVPWAAWIWARTTDRPDEATLARLWPTVRAAADAAAVSLDARGLPAATPDYWETTVDDVTVGTAAPLLAGLRAASALAGDVGDAAARERWSAAARRLAGAVERHFGPTGYRRTPHPRSGADAAVALLAPPFGPTDPAVDAAIADSVRRLRTPGGALLPGEAWRGQRTVGWTPAAGMIALAAAASGRTDEADAWLEWFAGIRTEVGALPEKVDPDGRPASVAPLAWTDALVLLTLVARDTGLPVPPV